MITLVPAFIPNRLIPEGIEPRYRPDWRKENLPKYCVMTKDGRNIGDFSTLDEVTAFLEAFRRLDSEGMIAKKNLEPTKCPHCKSENITADRFETDAGEAWRNVSCDDCGFECMETFVFKSWEPAEVQTDEMFNRENPSIP